jgi:acyl-CoA-binding protein
MQSEPIANNNWLSAIETLKGICIRGFAEKNYLNLVEEISNQAGQKISL